MREMHAQKKFWCRCSQTKREAGNAIEPVWNRRACVSSAVKIAYAEVNPDYTRRPDPSELFPTLDRLKRSQAA
jgi:hypothetical protein